MDLLRAVAMTRFHGMSPRDLRLWAKEEVRDALEELLAKRCADLDTDADEKLALGREVNRVVKFIGLPRKPRKVES